MITAEEYDILEHCSRTGRYVSDEALAIELGKRGLMQDYGPQKLADGMHYLTMTPAGREALVEYRATLPKPKLAPKRKQQRRQRYQRFLEYGDMFRNFRAFLAWDMETERSWNR